MADDKMTPLAPIHVALIGTGTGDGSPMQSGQILVTPDHQPNIVLRVISPLLALSIRFGETFLTALLGGTGVDTITSYAQITDLQVSGRMIIVMALGAATLGLVKDLIVILGKLKQKFPLLDM